MKKFAALALLPLLAVGTAHARDTSHGHADEAVIAAQNAALDKNTDGKGFGPQAPRDLAMKKGSNQRVFSTAPAYTQMNLCNSVGQWCQGNAFKEDHAHGVRNLVINEKLLSPMK